jgi:pimeloyl-ACP methyl ester carboxylesterase
MSATSSIAGWRRRGVAAATAVVTGLSLAAAVAEPVAARPEPVRAAAAAPTLTWKTCADGFQCARLRVPLDYDRPAGPKISVSVLRLRAGDPERRIGSLFINPGGPGGSGVDAVRYLAPFLPLELRGRFDIVGFDPRGVMRSTPLRCYQTFEESFGDQPQIPFPRTTRQEDRWIALNKRFANACRQRGGPILGHMSTGDVARDMDQLRQALGEEQLSYFGYSYGSALGQTYANMFPGRSRAIVIDGVLDPVAWTSGGADGRTLPVTARLRSAEGARTTLNAFFRLCDRAGRYCDFSGNARQRYDALANRLSRNPIDLGGGAFFTYQDLIAITLGLLYAAPAYPFLAAFLSEVEQLASGREVRAALERLRNRMGLAQEQYPNFVEATPGVICSDATNPRHYARWRSAADQTSRTQGRFARLWLWLAGPCAAWPLRAGQDRYDGPWNAATANPVLVVGNYHDPATPYSGALAAHRLLGRSTLLTYAGWGHTAFFTGNYCIDEAVTTYLVTTRTPPAGTVCRPNGSPFGPAEGRSESAQMLAKILVPTMPDAVRRALDPRH